MNSFIQTSYIQTKITDFLKNIDTQLQLIDELKREVELVEQIFNAKEVAEDYNIILQNDINADE